MFMLSSVKAIVPDTVMSNDNKKMCLFPHCICVHLFTACYRCKRLQVLYTQHISEQLHVKRIQLVFENKVNYLEESI